MSDSDDSEYMSDPYEDSEQESNSDEDSAQEWDSDEDSVQESDSHQNSVQESDSDQDSVHESDSDQDSVQESDSDQDSVQESDSAQNSVQESDSDQDSVQESDSDQDSEQESNSDQDSEQESDSDQDSERESDSDQDSEQESDSDQDTGDYGTYYHYTDKYSAKKIKKSGVIYESREEVADDAVCGDGVYLTQLAPSNDTDIIAENNYDDSFSLPVSKIDDGKLDYVIEIRIRKDQVEDHTEDTGRDVHLYPDDLLLYGDDVRDFKIYAKN